MRAIDKSKEKIKATSYKKWIDELTAEGKDCTNYYSNHKYCKDIKANLLLIQQGLCAYTEIELDDISRFKEDDWVDGVYVGNCEFEGSLDHFDSSLKKKGYKSWLWENFFLVHPKINNVKNDTDILALMKPDEEGYDPTNFLDYDSDLHIFTVSEKITEETQRKAVQSMIDNCSLLNYGFIARKRKKYLDNALANYFLGRQTLDTITVDQFNTAFMFIRLNQV